MKLIKGGELTLRGAVPVDAATGFTKRINFFDGDYRHGYRVTKFQVGTNLANGGSDVVGKLMTAEPEDPNDAFWNWADNREIAWAGFEMLATITPTRSTEGYSLVTRDNLVIEDLYITVRSRDVNSPEVFYYIELEKYELASYQGTLSIVGNMSQG